MHSASFAPPPLATEDATRLDKLYGTLKGHLNSFVGYPCNQEFDYRELYRFLEFSINNIGDPFADSIFRLNTYEFEREVVAEVADLCKGTMDDLWGYVTSGGTEGNMYGIYLARETHPDGIVYYSEHTHYSAVKIVRALGCRSIMIRGRDDGRIDLDDLRETLRLHRDTPPIIFANAGNTMHQAVDDIPGIQQIFRDLAITRHYLHVDAAFSGLILPFVKDAPPWNFAAGADSMAISGHKLLGSPVPCGVVLANRNHVSRIARSIEYVGCMDTTIAGSRSGISPLIMWTALKRYGRDGLGQMVQSCFDRADKAIALFAEHGIEAWRHPHAITVVFPCPSEDILRKWQIAPQGTIAHIIMLPHLHDDMLEALVNDIASNPVPIR
jgi:histidine decarboxylase